MSSTVIKYPAPILKKKTKIIKSVTDEHREILDKMADVMRHNKGIGLAATQVGLNVQMAVVDAGEGLLKIINPCITKKYGANTVEEGCLSIPSVLVKVKRSKKIELKYIDEWGNQVKKQISGLTAKAVQHEIDHLNGKLITDYLPWYKRAFAKIRDKL